MGAIEGMRILLLAGPIPQDSGVASHLLCLAKQLSDRGHQVALATRLMGREEGQRIPSTLYFSQFNDYLQYYYLLSPNLGLGNQFAERIRNLKLILNSFRDIKKIIQDYKPDVIHSHSFSTSLKLNLIEIKNPTPFVTTLHQDMQVSRSRFEQKISHIFFTIYSGNSSLKTFNIKKRSVLGNAVIAISSELKQQIKQRFAVDENAIHLIHHGVDESQFKLISLDDRVQSRGTIGIPAEAKVVCLIGSLERRKGHDQLIKSLQILRLEGIEVYALFAGAEKGEWKGEIEQLAIDLNVADLIKWLGFTKTYSVLAASDVLVAPSRYEAFLLVAIESMLCGVVPIRTPTAGASAQIDDGINGFIVPHEDPQTLAQKLKLILFNDALRAEMAIAAQQKASTEFTLDAMVDKTISVYKEIL